MWRRKLGLLAEAGRNLLCTNAVVLNKKIEINLKYYEKFKEIKQKRT